MKSNLLIERMDFMPIYGCGTQKEMSVTACLMRSPKFTRSLSLRLAKILKFSALKKKFQAAA
ncbi:hypothetical protein GCK32_009449 [Trichostrongylus colubriformis]|uniref:Uncharacterized protein n=1 Tax=Trichostrongylus colubriformis TaxID=6319 RepID=A0AAN8FNN4_TRICO